MKALVNAVRLWAVPVGLLLAWAGLAAGTISGLARLPVVSNSGQDEASEVYLLVPGQRPQKAPPAPAPGPRTPTGCSQHACWT